MNDVKSALRQESRQLVQAGNLCDARLWGVILRIAAKRCSMGGLEVANLESSSVQ